jgi:hypothetical protein
VDPAAELACDLVITLRSMFLNQEDIRPPPFDRVRFSIDLVFDGANHFRAGKRAAHLLVPVYDLVDKLLSAHCRLSSVRVEPRLLIVF